MSPAWMIVVPLIEIRKPRFEGRGKNSLLNLFEVEVLLVSVSIIQQVSKNGAWSSERADLVLIRVHISSFQIWTSP